MKHLSIRTADSLYWLGRYAQRFETVAREINRSFDLIIDVDNDAGKRLFEKLDYDVHYMSARDFIKQAIQEIPFSSLAYIIQNARENAIASRDTISDHAFSCINAIYNRIVLEKSIQTPLDIEEMIRELDRFWGLISVTLNKSQAYRLIQYGQAIEILDLELRLYGDTKLVSLDVVRLNELGRSIDARYVPLVLNGSPLLEAIELVNTKITTLIHYEI